MRQAELSREISQFRHELRRKWFRWGLLPVLALVLLGTGASAVLAAPQDTSERAQELRLQFAMALAAAAFLAGFWTEGYKTSADKVLRRVTRMRAVPLSQITREDIQQSSSAVRETLEEAHWTALAFGWMVGAAILIGAMAGMPPKHCLIVGVMAFLYELYLFSRHWHAVELFAGALSGELVHEARMVAEQEQFHPSAWQKAAMWLGWRPRPANNPTAHRTRQRQRR